MTGYTAGGLRAWKQTASGTTYYLYDGSTPVCELNSSGALTAVNTFGATGLVSRHAGASTFYTFDPQGSVAQRLDGSGAIQGSYLFDAYGSRAGTDNTTDPYSGFEGQYGYYSDSETGLQLLSHRYYDTSTGRFLTRDPLGYAGGINLYAYTGDNPINGVDPTGYAEWYDVLASKAAAYFGGLQQENEQAFGGCNGSWVVAGVLNSFLSAANGIYQMPASIGHFGEGAGAYSVDPSAENSIGLWNDIGIASSFALGPLMAEYEAGLGCFVAGTPVQMADGTTKPIEKLKAGDLVQSRNAKTGKTEAKIVLHTTIRHIRKILTLAFTDQHSGKLVETITTTDEHPFYLQGKGFVPAGRLAVGNSIVTRAGPSLQVAYITHTYKPTGYTVYNLVVDGDHTYFVGKANSGIWVHNNDSCLLRAQELHSLLDEKAQIHRTTAVLETEEGITIVASSNRVLAPIQRNALTSTEVAAVGPAGAHAEINAINTAQELGLSPTTIAASWGICPDCAAEIKAAGINFGSPLK